MPVKYSQELKYNNQLNLSFLSDRIEIHDHPPNWHALNKNFLYLKISITSSVKATSCALSLSLNMLLSCPSQAHLWSHIINWTFRTTGVSDVHLDCVRKLKLTLVKKQLNPLQKQR